MAKNKKKRRKFSASPSESAGSAVVVAGEELEEDRFSASGNGRDSGSDSAGDGRDGSDGHGGGPPPGGSGGSRRPGPTSGGAGLFAVYKPGQGYYTRLLTGVGCGLVLMFGAHYIYGQLGGLSPAVQMGVPSAFLAVTGLVLFWITGLKRSTSDFFIATEGEMKKVSWSSNKEVIGSTKVVLIFTLVIATFLFVVDILFLVFFSSMGVLQMDIKTLLGLES